MKSHQRLFGLAVTVWFVHVLAGAPEMSLAETIGPIASGPENAASATLTLSDICSEPHTIPAEMLDATLDFQVSDQTLFLTVTNDTTAPNTFDVNRVFLNASEDVLGLTLAGATHSVEGDVLGPWSLEPSAGDGGTTHVGGFGFFDYALVDGVGNAPEMIGPGESVAFELSIAGVGPFAPGDFIGQWSQQTPGGGNRRTLAAAKFVGGNVVMFGVEDGAFGAAVPEPSTLTLVALALLGLATYVWRRRA